MFDLKIGIKWIAISAPTFAIALFFTANSAPFPKNLTILLPIALFALLCESIGIIFLANGIKKVMHDKEIEKNGDITYGKIVDIHPTGISRNHVSELNVTILTYINDEGIARELHEIVVSDNYLYKVGDFVNLKQYLDGVKIIKVVSPNEVDERYLYALD